MIIFDEDRPSDSPVVERRPGPRSRRNTKDWHHIRKIGPNFLLK